MEITGRVFCVNELGPKVAQLVIKKKMAGKVRLLPITVLGYWRDQVVNVLKPLKNEKVNAVIVIEGKLFRGRYQTEIIAKRVSIERVEPTPGKDDGFLGYGGHIYDKDGKILL